MIFQIICMFPDIQREYRVETECERIVLIRKSHDGRRAVRTDNQPRTAGSELSKGGRLHVREKLPAGVIVLQYGRSNLLSRRGQDRKSTRLNSSHVSTSYAVFCLKQQKL